MNNLNSEKIEKAIVEAKASMAIEGYSYTDEEIEIVRKNVSGEITEEEFGKILKQRYLK